MGLLSLAGGFLLVSTIRLASDQTRSIMGSNPFASRVPEEGSPAISSGKQTRSDDVNVKTVSLWRTDNSDSACGLFIFDPLVSQIHVYLNDLQSLDGNERYYLWFIDAVGEPFGATPLVVESGDVRQLIDVPASVFSAIVITIERQSKNPSRPSDRVAIRSQDAIDGV